MQYIAIFLVYGIVTFIILNRWVWENFRHDFISLFNIHYVISHYMAIILFFTPLIWPIYLVYKTISYGPRVINEAFVYIKYRGPIESVQREQIIGKLKSELDRKTPGENHGI